ncbi:MAG: hypothetical protein A2992_04055 [Elusimicrobia bacterium RIFCSPLOWO2_01_FULL_59_12]|nr:MAG: hypothetical protein A2992_04055 [Elusimicrobia bacterium RIFCSPLOWO2_01_FULL_59_12]
MSDISDASSPFPPAPKAKPRTFLRAMDRVLYPITLGYTAVIFAFQLYEFFQGGAFKPRFQFGDVYLALLTAYAAQREGSKWLGVDEATMRIRRGEIFIGLWFALYLAIVACANLSDRWVLPQELKTITLGVLGIFAATGLSVGLRQARGPSRVPPTSQEESDRRVQMIRLLHDRGPITSQEAAETLGISQSTAWRILEGLVKTGHARQVESANLRERRYALA